MTTSPRRLVSPTAAIVLCIAATMPTSGWGQQYQQQIEQLAATTSESIAASGKKRVAVVDFTDLQGNVTELGRFLAEELSVTLVSTGKEFEVIDRTHLKAILKEHNLAATGMIDPATARKLGQIAGVDGIITGNLTPLGDNVRVSVKVLDVESARIIGAATGNIASTKGIAELLARGVSSATKAEVAGSGAGTAREDSAAVTTAQQAGLEFAVSRCVRSGDQVTCNLLVTNQGNEDREVMLYGSGGDKTSFVTDDLNEQHLVVRVSLRNSDREKYTRWVVLEPDLRTPASIVMEGVSPRASSIDIVLKFASGDGDNQVLFRGIALVEA